VSHPDFKAPCANLLDLTQALLAHVPHGEHGLVGVPETSGAADATVKLRQAGSDADVAAAALTGASPVAQAWAARGHIELRFDDDRIAALGAALECGAPEALDTSDLRAGERWIVDFSDPNATKALHVGHLRNVAIGQCLARMAEAAGISVTRYSRVSDFGRSTGEALAGYLRYGEGRSPAQHGVKGDHLIGDCYARYVIDMTTDERAELSDERADQALSREKDTRHDLADELLERWRSDDKEIARLYKQVREWTIDGQDATLARLGIVMDCNLLESDYLDEGERFVDAAVARGIITKTAGGATVYETGAKDYPRLLLQRNDGFPTQHLRYLATYLVARPLMVGATSISVLGQEWANLARYTVEILRQFEPDVDIHPKVVVTHEMVVGKDGVVKSSKGDAPLIDVLLDMLAASEPVAELCARCERCEPERVAATVGLGYFLGQPVTKRVMLSPDDLLDERKSVGWMLVRAWSKAWDSEFDGPPDPHAEDEVYRFVAAHSQRHRRLLARALEGYEGFKLVRFHFHFARWFNDLTGLTPPVARAARTVLDAGLQTLGLPAPGTPGLTGEAT